MPLALRDGFPDRLVDAFSGRLDEISDPRTLLVISADFSHYLDWNFSRFHDEESLEMLWKQDDARADSMDVDCASCMRMAIQYAKRHGADSFHLLSRSSSLEMLGSDVVGEETSHISGYFSTEPVVATDSTATARLLFSGSVTPENMTVAARRIFMGQDADILRRNEEEMTGSFDITSASRLRAVEPVFSDQETFSSRKIDGKTITFVRGDDTDVSQITAAKSQSDRVVVLEGEKFGDFPQKERLRQNEAFIDAGADVVMNTGGKTLEPLTMYRGKPIFSSLGSLTTDCSSAQSRCVALMVGIGFSDTATELDFMPVTRDTHGLAVLETGQGRSASLETLAAMASDRGLEQSILGGRVILPEEKPF